MADDVADLGIRLSGEVGPYVAAMNRATEAGDRTAMSAERTAEKVKASTVAMSTSAASSATAATAAASRHEAAMNKIAGSYRMAALGVAGVGLISLKMAGDFQASTNILVTAAGESQKALAGIRAGILDISTQTGTPLKMLTEGMYQVEKAGYRSSDGLKVLRAAAQGAKEENASLASVTNAMTSVMASYHLRATDSVRVMNALKTAAGESKTTMEQYATALSTVIPIASANKIGFEQVAGAIATLTQHGTSAAEATQELASTNRNLAAPNRVAQPEMQQLGLSVNDVSTRMGQRGLTGTVDLLVNAITTHMGPAGTVMLNAFNQSKTAAQDATIMISKMPPELSKLAQEFANGSISLGDWRKGIKALPADQAAMATQFAALQLKAGGFNDLIKAGSPAAQTFTDALKRMSGGAIGLNTILQLSGENMGGFRTRVDAVHKSLNDTRPDVEGFASTQHTFNNQVDRGKASAVALAVSIGTQLLPVASHAIGIFASVASHIAGNTVASHALAVMIGTVLAGAITVYIAKMAIATAQMVMFAARTIAVNAAVAAAIVADSATEVVAIYGVRTAVIGLTASFAALTVAVGVAYAAWKYFQNEKDIAAINKQGDAYGVQAKQMHEKNVQRTKDRSAFAQLDITHMVAGARPNAAYHPGGIPSGAHPSRGGGGLGATANHDAATIAGAHHSAATKAAKSHHDAAAKIAAAHAHAAAEARRHAHEIAMAHQHAANLAKHAAISTVTAARDAVAAQVTDVHKAIASMQSDLDGLIKTRDSYSSSLQAGIGKGQGDAAGLFGGGADITSVISTLQSQLAGTKAFGSQIGALQAAGGSQDLLKQVAEQGAGAGGAFATALLAQGPDAVKAVSDLMGQISAASKTAADAVAGAYYDQGIDSMQHLIDGMASKEKALQAQVDKVSAILKTLHDSPASVSAANKAVAGAAAAVRPASGATSSPATHVTVTVPVHLDGKVIATVIAPYNRDDLREYARLNGKPAPV